MLRDSRVWFDRVRPGLLLYGIVPPPLASTIQLAPVMSLISRVVAVKGLRPGEITGYGATIHGRAPDDDRDRAGRLRRRPGSAARRARLRADPRPPRADRRLGVHGHDHGRRHRHGRVAGRRGRDHRIARATIASTCARWPRRSARFRGRLFAASARASSASTHNASACTCCTIESATKTRRHDASHIIDPA